MSPNSLPPKILLFGILPPVSLIVWMFSNKKINHFEWFNLQRGTWIHAIRLPIELTLFALCTQKLVPKVMTFEGANFDILAGITAPIVALFAFKNSQPIRSPFIAWNVIGIGLLINIVVIALSQPLLLSKGYHLANQTWRFCNFPSHSFQRLWSLSYLQLISSRSVRCSAKGRKKREAKIPPPLLAS